MRIAQKLMDHAIQNAWIEILERFNTRQLERHFVCPSHSYSRCLEKLEAYREDLLDVI